MASRTPFPVRFETRGAGRPLAQSLTVMLALLILPAAPGLARPPSPAAPSQEVAAWHTLRPGETLQAVAGRYPESERLWRERPELSLGAGPVALSAGQRVPVLLAPATPAVRLIRMSRDVHNQPVPLGWSHSQEEDLLLEQDRHRTRRSSSSRLLFPDGWELYLSEDSSIALAETRLPELLEGQVDAYADRDPEILAGEFRTEFGPNAAGDAWVRIRRSAGGTVQVMSYLGESVVRHPGFTLTLPEGMGTVFEGARPGAPEELLEAPSGLVPPPGSRSPSPSPTFSWQPVPGASSYVVEVCRDPRCGQLEIRAQVPALTWGVPFALPAADYYWRVTAVGPTGLDGYPSPPATFRTPDRPPPVVASPVLSLPPPPRPGLPWPIVTPDVGRPFEPGPEVEDLQVTIDGQEVSLDDLRQPLPKGPHSVQFSYTDPQGNRLRSDLQRFVVDPDPPQLRWAREDSGELRDLSPEFLAELEEAVAARSVAGGAEQDWRLESEASQVILRPARRKYRIAGPEWRLKPKRGLRIVAADETCGPVEDLRTEIVERGTGELLVVEAVDCAGNRSRFEWPLAKVRRCRGD